MNRVDKKISKCVPLTMKKKKKAGLNVDVEWQKVINFKHLTEEEVNVELQTAINYPSKKKSCFLRSEKEMRMIAQS